MNTAHYHLLVNHLPILGTLFGILTLAGGFVFKNTSVKRTGLVFMVFATLAVFPSNFTGEQAEDAVEGIAGIDKNYIETHEEAANVFMGVAIVMGLFAIFTLVADILKFRYAQLLYVVTLVIAAIALVFAQKTGTTGGEIRHTEIRTATAPAATNAGNTEPVDGNGNEEDD